MLTRRSFLRVVAAGGAGWCASNLFAQPAPANAVTAPPCLAGRLIAGSPAASSPLSGRRRWRRAAIPMARSARLLTADRIPSARTSFRRKDAMVRSPRRFTPMTTPCWSVSVLPCPDWCYTHVPGNPSRTRAVPPVAARLVSRRSNEDESASAVCAENSWCHGRLRGGIIDATSLIFLADAASRLAFNDECIARPFSGVKPWFARYVDWLLTSAPGRRRTRPRTTLVPGMMPRRYASRHSPTGPISPGGKSSNAPCEGSKSRSSPTAGSQLSCAARSP